MSKVRDLIEQIPYIADCETPERFSKRNTMIFDYEIENPDSVFAYSDSDKAGNRMAPIDIPAQYIGKPEIYALAMDRLKIAMLSYDKSKGRITTDQETELDTLVSSSTSVDSIDSIITVDQAVVMDVWS